MSLISKQMEGYLGRASMIRRMFEQGIALKKEHGEDAVCDFSLGNPDLPSPASIKTKLADLAKHADEPGIFGYMPNGGYPWVREALAKYLAAEQQSPVGPEDVLITCGAAGAINALFRAVLNPGDEVLAIAPYFVEYGFYTENSGGCFRAVNSAPDFTPDMDALEAAFTPSVRALIVNSPNNPTGQVYTRQQMQAIAALLGRKSKEYGRPIYLVSDEPYRFLTYDGVKVEPVLPLYEYTVAVGSFSKSLGLAGERVGYLAIAPQMPDKQTLINACTLTNRILGFVNPPVIGQHLMAAGLGSEVDTGIYARRRDKMAAVLDGAGIEYIMPKGAFYFFPKAPGGDDQAFVKSLVDELILAVPGTGFGCPGHFRMTFCVDEKIIDRSAQGFIRAANKYK